MIAPHHQKRCGDPFLDFCAFVKALRWKLLICFNKKPRFRHKEWWVLSTKNLKQKQQKAECETKKQNHCSKTKSFAKSLFDCISSHNRVKSLLLWTLIWFVTSTHDKKSHLVSPHSFFLRILFVFFSFWNNSLLKQKAVKTNLKYFRLLYRIPSSSFFFSVFSFNKKKNRNKIKKNLKSKVTENQKGPRIKSNRKSNQKSLHNQKRKSFPFQNYAKLPQSKKSFPFQISSNSHFLSPQIILKKKIKSSNQIKK